MSARAVNHLPVYAASRSPVPGGRGLPVKRIVEYTYEEEPEYDEDAEPEMAEDPEEEDQLEQNQGDEEAFIANDELDVGETEAAYEAAYADELAQAAKPAPHPIAAKLVAKPTNGVRPVNKPAVASKVPPKPAQKTVPKAAPKPSPQQPKSKDPAPKAEPPKAPFHNKYPQDRHHSALMALYDDIASTGVTEDHIHSFVHVASLMMAYLAKAAGMTAPQAASFEKGFEEDVDEGIDTARKLQHKK